MEGAGVDPQTVAGLNPGIRNIRVLSGVEHAAPPILISFRHQRPLPSRQRLCSSTIFLPPLPPLLSRDC